MNEIYRIIPKKEEKSEKQTGKLVSDSERLSAVGSDKENRVLPLSALSAMFLRNPICPKSTSLQQSNRIKRSVWSTSSYFLVPLKFFSQVLTISTIFHRELYSVGQTIITFAAQRKA